MPNEEHPKFIRLEKAVAAAGYLLSNVVLIEPLRISIDGSQRAVLEACRCRITLLNMEAKSLNHALTLLSQWFEPARMSHGGNVFRQGFTTVNGRFCSLDELRLAKVSEFIKSSEEKAVPGEGD